MTDWPKPSLTADLVIVVDGHVLLIERAHDPFAGRWALPGGFVDANESAEQAAVRELREETGVQIGADDLVQIGAFSDPGRDPRGWVVTVAFRADLPDRPRTAAADDARRVGWHPLNDPPELAFDHARIIEQAVRVSR